MFEIDENNIPIVQTRQALLALDLQNEFVSTGSILQADNPSDFVDRIVSLAPHFRRSGDVLWVRSVFEKSRPVNLEHGDSEHVITDRQLVAEAREVGKGKPSRPSQKLLERYSKIADFNGRKSEDSEELEVDDEETEVIGETFLTIEPGHQPQFVLNGSIGINFSDSVTTGLDGKHDLVFSKTHYSAFKDGSLVQILRSRFVTDIYICGALTNISVFATAMDAARHGYAITIIEDCLGYRSKDRHNEALRQLEEFTGCDIISSGELLEDLAARQKKSKAKESAPKQNPRPRQKDISLENLMSNLSLKRESSAASRSGQQSAPEKLTTAKRKGTEKRFEKKLPNAADQPALATAAKPSSRIVPAGESSGSSESQLANEAGEVKLPINHPEPQAKQPRDRVKTKLKARRRPQEVAAAAPATNSKGPVSPTSAALSAASQKLEKMSPSSETESDLPIVPESNPQPAKDFGKGEEITFGSEITMPLKSEKEDGLGPICEGDTEVIHNILSEELAESIFETVRDEVRWQKMSHQGGDVPRLVAVQGSFSEDGSIPIYRHPADESPPLFPFSPVVNEIRLQIEKRLGHALNHVLIQFYRDGTDHITEHSDKTLDIVPNTFIVNISLGAQRTMVFRTKKQPKGDDTPKDVAEPRKSSRAPLPHNSMCKMGLATNMRWLHGIRPDKRMLSEKSEAELAFNGGRISLTFRDIGTFLDKDHQKIWGQGATSKIKEDAKTVINGNTPEAEQMIRAFGKENHSSEFDWSEHYAKGFDVLHISNSPKLFLSGDSIADLRVKILLAEYNIPWTEGKLSPSFNWRDGSLSKTAPSIPDNLPVKFVDNDLSKSTVVGDKAVMMYLDAVYGSTSKKSFSRADLARQFTRFQQSDELLKKWRAVPFSAKPFQRELELWESFATEAAFIAGSTISLADYAAFPILDDVAAQWGPQGCSLENLCAYYQRMKDVEVIKKALTYDGKEQFRDRDAAST